MKVTKSQAEIEQNTRWASWLSFLRQAKRVTLQSLAERHGTHRSNLSAYVSSVGKVRNISLEKLTAILFDLGIIEGILTPGLHRWDVTGNDEMIPVMCNLLMKNDFDRGLIFELGSGYGVYVVIQVTSNIMIFANLPPNTTDLVIAGLPGLADKLRVVALDRAGDSQIQSLWMTESNKDVQRDLVSLMG